MELPTAMGTVNPFFAIAFLIWVIFWKSLALWRSAKGNQINWFIIILILNSLTLGIVEIIYLFGFSKPKMTLEDLKKMKLLPKN